MQLFCNLNHILIIFYSHFIFCNMDKKHFHTKNWFHLQWCFRAFFDVITARHRISFFCQVLLRCRKEKIVVILKSRKGWFFFLDGELNFQIKSRNSYMKVVSLVAPCKELWIFGPIHCICSLQSFTICRESLNLKPPPPKKKKVGVVVRALLDSASIVLANCVL